MVVVADRDTDAPVPVSTPPAPRLTSPPPGVVMPMLPLGEAVSATPPEAPTRDRAAAPEPPPPPPLVLGDPPHTMVGPWEDRERGPEGEVKYPPPGPALATKAPPATKLEPPSLVVRMLGAASTAEVEPDRESVTPAARSVEVEARSM